MDRITYDITKTIWKNDVCLKANLRDKIDYSWEDHNYNAKGTKKVPMTKKNMHAFEGHIINTDLIEIISDKNGKPRTTWDVFKEMALFYKKEYPNKEYLPVEEWEVRNEEDGKTEIHHEKDYLSMFIEMEKNEREENIEKDNERKNFMTQEIGKSTINIPTIQKDVVKNKILNKVHERSQQNEKMEK